MSDTIITYNHTTQSNVYDNVFVLRLDQLDNDSNEPDMVVYIFYDAVEELFYVFGSRKSFSKYPGTDFEKFFYYIKDMYNFLDVLMDLKHCKCNSYFYKMDGLPENCTYDRLHKKSKDFYEIGGYDNVKVTNKIFKKYLSMIL